MRLTKDECINKCSKLDDSLELATKLEELATDQDEINAYFLREAAINLKTAFVLARSVALHLKDAPQSAIKTPAAQTQNTKKERMLRPAEVMEITGLGKSSLYSYVRLGLFPKPIKLKRAALYPESVIQDWMEKKIKNTYPTPT